MHRARKRLVGALSTALALLLPTAASAFHAGSLFDKPPGAGGAGSIFYTGAPLDKGWTCTACHTEAPGKVRVRLEVEPPELFQSFRYEPGRTYTFTATMEFSEADGVQERGVASPQANFNTIAVSIVDAGGLSVGTMSGFAAEDFYTGWPTTIVSSGQKTGVTSWTFAWTPAVAGPVQVHVAAVDGNGANSAPTATLTDPFGDDVFVGTVQLEPGATAKLAPQRRALERHTADGDREQQATLVAAQPLEAAPSASRATAHRPSWGVAAIASGLGAAVLGASIRRRRRFGAEG